MKSHSEIEEKKRQVVCLAKLTAWSSDAYRVRWSISTLQLTPGWALTDRIRLFVALFGHQKIAETVKDAEEVLVRRIGTYGVNGENLH